MKKKICLNIKMIKEEPFITTFYFILLCALTFILNLSVASYEGANYEYRMLSREKGSISMLMYPYEENENESWEIREKKKNDYYKTIFQKMEQDPNIKEIDTTWQYYFNIESKYTFIRGYRYNANFFQNINMNLSKGRWFQSEDEIVLTKCASRFFHIGDTIELVDAKERQKQFHVVGFLANDLVVDNDVMASKHDTIEGYEYDNLITDEKRRLTSAEYVAILSPHYNLDCWQYSLTSFIKFDEKLSVEEATSYLSKKYGEYAEFYEFNEPYDEYKENFISIKNREEIYLVFCMLILFCTGFCVNNILRIQKKSVEFGIYYIFGLTWRESVALSYMKNLVIFFIAIPVGSLGAFIECIMDDSNGWIFETSNALLIFCSLIFIYILVSLPTYFRYRKQDPITLQRQGDIQ